MRTSLPLRPLVLVAAAMLLVPGLSCYSGGKIRADSDVIRNDLGRADKQNAKRCAPREYALAEANLDFADGELDEGDSVRAHDHIQIAEDNVKKALVLSKDCGPKQVVIRDKPKVTVQVLDRDGDGVPDAEDLCPDVPGPKENHGCPIDKDTDGDGIPDSVDKCPTQPEDFDGYQDEDGCPEPDNDGDGIVDSRDRCPNNPGPLETQGCPDRDGDKVADWEDLCPDVPGIPENHGCPGDRDGDGVPDNVDKCPDQPGPKENNGCPVKVYKLVVRKKDKLEIKQQVHFATNKSKVLPDSFELLNEVAALLKDNADIKKVRIEGHTDSVGSDSHNMKLSQDRANSVMTYVIQQGVDPTRLEAVGYGPSRPIASNATAKGRAANRRTEFNITEQEGVNPGSTPSETPTETPPVP
jgi:outer membrane protein OmpA-like peptidoglycan-associated protein